MSTIRVTCVESEWTQKRLGDVCRPVGGGTPSRSQPQYWNGDIPWASVKDFTDESVVLNDTQEHITHEGLESSASRLVAKNTPVVCTRMAVGRCALTSRPTAINQDLKALILNGEFEPKFFIRMLRRHGPDLERLSIGSTVRGISISDLVALNLCFPTNPEQTRIAAVLDTIDEAIAKTESVIAKLRQVRAGLLYDLLTRGLDENGELRDFIGHPEQFQNSPLGRIPKEWEVQRLGDLISSAVDGPFGSNLKTKHYVNQPGVRVVRLQNVETGRFNDADKAYVSTEHAATLSRHQVVSGDLLIASMGDENHPIARACLYPQNFDPGVVKADCFRLRMNSKRAVNGYVMHFMNCPSTRGEVNLLGQGVTRDRVNLTTLLTLRVTRPHVNEQNEIINRVAAVDKTVGAELGAHAKLTLLKSGLMNDLLTGRVRVPELIGAFA